MTTLATAPAEMPATDSTATTANSAANNTPSAVSTGGNRAGKTIAAQQAASRPADPRQAGFKEEIHTPDQTYNGNVPLDVIERDPGNRVPTKDAIAALAETIRIEGLLQPVTLRDLGGGKYRIIAGETRCEAFRLLKRATIPAMIRPKEAGAEAGPSQGDVAKRLVENLGRTDLNPVDQARGFKQLCELGRTQKEVGALFGLSQPVVANSIRILALPEETLDLIREGKLSAAHGVSLARFAKFPKIVSRMADCAVANRHYSAKDLDRHEVPFAHDLIRGGWVLDIRTRASWASAKDPFYVVPKELLDRPEFIEADYCVYYLREPGTPDLWTPEKKKQDEAREAKAKAAAAKSAKAVASGKKTAEQLAREKKLVANRRLRWELGRAKRDACAALVAAKEVTHDMLAVLIEHALKHNGNGNAVEDAEEDLHLFTTASKNEAQPADKAYQDFDYADGGFMRDPLKAAKLAVMSVLLREYEGDMRFLSRVSPELQVIARSAPKRTAEQELSLAAEEAEVSSAKFVVIAAGLADENAKVGDIAKRNGVTPDKVKAVRTALEFDDTLRTICAQMHATAEALRNKDPQRAAVVAKGKGGKIQAITDQVKLQVRTLALAGKTTHEIGTALGISLPSVQNIKKGFGLLDGGKKK